MASHAVVGMNGDSYIKSTTWRWKHKLLASKIFRAHNNPQLFMTTAKIRNFNNCGPSQNSSSINSACNQWVLDQKWFFLWPKIK